MRLDSGTGVLLSAEERREVLSQIGGALCDMSKEIGGQFNMGGVYHGRRDLTRRYDTFTMSLRN